MIPTRFNTNRYFDFLKDKSCGHFVVLVARARNRNRCLFAITTNRFGYDYEHRCAEHERSIIFCHGYITLGIVYHHIR